ncbi:MAG: pyridoxamine 5'-phosphate oxidase family protein [Marinoscillum sp.]
MSRKTEKTIPSRMANQRAHYSDEMIYSILDEALFCTLSYSENNEPFSIPQSFVRMDNYIYVHGSVGSHLMRTLSDGRSVCVTIMLADELVVAKTAFHHSVNYRSVVVFAKGELIEDEDLKYEAFKQLTEKMVPNSWDYLIPMTKKEMAKTTGIRFSLDEASAKIRAGWPGHEESEADFPVWTGLIPIKPLRQAPVPDEQGQKIPLPDHLK